MANAAGNPRQFPSILGVALASPTSVLHVSFRAADVELAEVGAVLGYGRKGGLVQDQPGDDKGLQGRAAQQQVNQAGLEEGRVRGDGWRLSGD